MSVEATRWAIEHAPTDLGGSAMSVLLVMADVANRGRWWQVWIPRDEIARRARVADSTAGTALKTLEASAVISRVEPDDRHPEVRKAAPRTVVWRLHVDDPEHAIPVFRDSPEHADPSVLTRDSGVQDRDAPLFPRTQEERKEDPTKTRRLIAQEMASRWWESKTPRPVTPPFIAVVKMLDDALKAGWTRGQVGRALLGVDGVLVKWKLAEQLEKIRTDQSDDTPADPQSGMDRSRRSRG